MTEEEVRRIVREELAVLSEMLARQIALLERWCGLPSENDDTTLREEKQ